MPDVGASASGLLFSPQVSRMKKHANDRNNMASHSQTNHPGPNIRLYFHLKSLAAPDAPIACTRYPSRKSNCEML